MNPLIPRPPTHFLLDRRTKRLDSYAYKLQGAPGGYGMDVPFAADVQDIDEANMAVWIPFASGERRDGVGDLLEVAGIDTSRHRMNPIVLFDHAKQISLPVALSEEPTTKEYMVSIDPMTRTARAKAYFYRGKGSFVSPNGGVEPDYDHSLFCEQLFDLIVKRYVRAGSIGYQVLQASPLPPDYFKGTPQGLHLQKTLLLEVSAVVMPANADTVRKALCLKTIAGKPPSPVLVKSLSAYVPPKKAVMGYEGQKARLQHVKPADKTDHVRERLILGSTNRGDTARLGYDTYNRCTGEHQSRPVTTETGERDELRGQADYIARYQNNQEPSFVVETDTETGTESVPGDDPRLYRELRLNHVIHRAKPPQFNDEKAVHLLNVERSADPQDVQNLPGTSSRHDTIVERATMNPTSRVATPSRYTGGQSRFVEEISNEPRSRGETANYVRLAGDEGPEGERQGLGTVTAKPELIRELRQTGGYKAVNKAGADAARADYHRRVASGENEHIARSAAAHVGANIASQDHYRSGHQPTARRAGRDTYEEVILGDVTKRLKSIRAKYGRKATQKEHDEQVTSGSTQTPDVNTDAEPGGRLYHLRYQPHPSGQGYQRVDTPGSAGLTDVYTFRLPRGDADALDDLAFVRGQRQIASDFNITPGVSIDLMEIADELNRVKSIQDWEFELPQKQDPTIYVGMPNFRHNVSRIPEHALNDVYSSHNYRVSDDAEETAQCNWELGTEMLDSEFNEEEFNSTPEALVHKWKYDGTGGINNPPTQEKGSVPVPHGDHSRTDYQPAVWKPGLGAIKASVDPYEEDPDVLDQFDDWWNEEMQGVRDDVVDRQGAKVINQRLKSIKAKYGRKATQKEYDEAHPLGAEIPPDVNTDAEPRGQLWHTTVTNRPNDALRPYDVTSTYQPEQNTELVYSNPHTREGVFRLIGSTRKRRDAESLDLIEAADALNRLPAQE